MTRIPWWIVNDDEAALDFDPVDENNLGLTSFHINLEQEVKLMESHLVELDENYFAAQYLVAQDPHLWSNFLENFFLSRLID